jgi:hypothetical protein
LKSLAELFEVLENLERVKKPLLYRLYHDPDGNPLFYSMENLPGQYIDITAEQFARSNSHVRVVDGKLIEKNFIYPKLIPTNDSGQRCYYRDVSIVTESSTLSQTWLLKYYE